MVKKVEIHQILIRNVIGGDSLELFEKQIQEENAPKTNSIESSKTLPLLLMSLFIRLKRMAKLT